MLIAARLLQYCQLLNSKLSYLDFRARDVRHLLADISKAQTYIGFALTIKVGAGIMAAMPWHVSKVARK
jgi:hypothetical protein